MRGDESRIIRIAELHEQLQDASAQNGALTSVVDLLARERNSINNDKVLIWMRSAIQNRQSLLRAKIARLLYSLEHDEAGTHTRMQADGDDDVADGVVIIR